MNKMKLVPVVVLSGLLLTACGNIEKGTSHLNPDTEKNQPVATGRIDNKSYESIVTDGHYQTSPLRGLTVNLLNSKENTANFERGLLDISKEHYPVNKFYFQEGQLLERERVLDLIERKSKENPDGINPEDPKKPYIFQQVIEQDYLNKKTNKVAGISLGIALNSVDYSAEPPINVSDSEIQEAGKAAAEKLLAEIRKMDGMKDIPVAIGLYKQANANEIAGGSYFAETLSESGKELSDWSAVSEEHITLLPGSNNKNSATDDGLETNFADFKNSIENFFPNNSGISGTAHYRNGDLQKTVIKIETKYFGETEIQNFVQYVARATKTLFNVPGEVEVQINSLDGPEGFVKKTPDSDEIITNIFN